MTQPSFRLLLTILAATCVVCRNSRAVASPPEVPPEERAATETLEEEHFDWAKERQFWSFQAPAASPRPAVMNREWPRRTVDYFVLARLESQGIRPSPEADHRTLLRRLSFDLTGLPPTPAETERFLADPRPDAYSHLVERLLASPRFGERFASLWLPLARYGEDQAHQVGNDTTMFYPNAYRYRQWVIDAFNQDLPYDQFIRFQLAADKVEGGSEHLAALGFLGLGPKYYNRNRLEVQADEWEDRIDTVSRTLLGLTVACARCHNHKFDPIPTRDYYALAGVFASTRMVNKTPSGQVIEGKVSADKMPDDTLHLVEDGDVHNLNIFIRGRPTRPGPVAERGFLRVLSAGEPKNFGEGSGRRELADSIASPGNPLTARVLVNRVWGALFGRPLVATPSDFGHSGLPPSNPALLDDLAVRFMQDGWSIHSLVRELVLSSTYRQESRNRPMTASNDASNDGFWRMNRRRLSIEQWRDTVLFLTGELTLEGGRSMEVDDPANMRRTVYGRISRLKLNDLLMQFDYPDANVHAERRSVTTTAPQKLFLLNSPFILERAARLASQISAAAGSDDARRVETAYRLCFSRAPDPTELRLALAFLRKPAASGMTRWEQYAQILLTSNELLYVD